MAWVGEYARVSDGTVFVYGCDQGRYRTVRAERDEECSHLECELTPWAPAPGERVAEFGNEDCIGGIVLEADESAALVAWTGFVDPQVWRNANLEPIFT